MDITCPLCSLVLKDPKGLLCNHAICNDCLSRHIENTFYIHDGHHGISCPSCQTFSPIPNPNKPIAYWSEDFMPKEDVANEINELKLSMMAAIPALRHNLNVFCHRYIQPVPLFSLSQVNKDYTFTSTWPKQQYRYLLHDRWRSSCQYQYKPRQRHNGFVSYQQPNTVSSLSVFTSVVPKVMHLIAETELGSKAYNVGQEVYDMIMSKVTPLDTVNPTDISPVTVSCDSDDHMGENSVIRGTNDILSSEMTSHKGNENTSKVDSESVKNTGVSPHTANGHENSQNETAVDAKTSGIIFGTQLPSIKTSEQVTHHEQIETKHVQKDGNTVQYITIQHNYYTTHIHSNANSEFNPTQNATIISSTNEVNPSHNANVLSTNDANTNQNATVPLSANEKPILGNDDKPDFLKGKLFEQPLQVPDWAKPQRTCMPGSSWTPRSIISKVSGFKNLFTQSMKEQINNYRSMPSCKTGAVNENAKVSKRAYSCCKNMQDRMKFGQNWRIHVRKARRPAGIGKRLVEIDPNTNYSSMSCVSLMITTDPKSAVSH